MAGQQSVDGRPAAAKPATVTVPPPPDDPMADDEIPIGSIEIGSDPFNAAVDLAEDIGPGRSPNGGYSCPMPYNPNASSGDSGSGGGDSDELPPAEPVLFSDD